MSRRRNKTGLWKGYTRPVWRDRAAWVALAVTAMLIAVQMPFWGLGDPSTWSWVGIGLDVVITVLVGFALVGTIVGFFRGFKQGVIEGLEPREGDLEHKARAVGRVVRGRRRARKP